MSERTAAMIAFVLAAVVASACQSPPTGSPTSTAPMLRPLGDGKVADEPTIGAVWSCQQRFDPNGPGADVDGEWIVDDRWDPTRKPTVDGRIDWPGSAITIEVVGDRRVVTANNLPDHPTGVFPIAADDDAYRYDRNPNSITEQEVMLALPAAPEPAPEPSCLPMGMIGVALSGGAIFNALDVRGRDAPAYEIQDECDGHPEVNGQYHYHDLSSCLADTGAVDGHSSLMGYALDGYGIYGPRSDDGSNVTNDELDACHGHIGEVEWDGVTVEVYHYHFTAEYPYTLGCFTGTPIPEALTPVGVPPGPPPPAP
jgi:hypothetical protein